MRLLVIGDFHVPDRAREIPLELANAIVTEHRKQPFSFLACTGDLTKVAIIEPVLNTWAPEKVNVQGNMDYDSRNAIGFPRKVTFDSSRLIKGAPVLTFAMTHGHHVHPRGDHQGLASMALSLDARAMISGHTHAPDIAIHQDKESGKDVLLLNPGSATGTWSFVASMKPSFLIVDMGAGDDGLRITITLHEIHETGDRPGRKAFTWDGERFSRGRKS